MKLGTSKRLSEFQQLNVIHNRYFCRKNIQRDAYTFTYQTVFESYRIIEEVQKTDTEIYHTSLM